MLPQDELTQRALDELYGLLDDTEAADLRAQLATPAGQSARQEAERIHKLLTSAAKMAFPEAQFTAPATEPKGKSQPVNRGWIAWVVAASVLGGFGIPMAAQMVNLGHLDHQIALAQNNVERTQKEFEKASTDWTRAQQSAEKEFQEANQTYSALVQSVRSETEKARQNIQSTRLNILVSGPAAITPGAPNSFNIETRDLAGQVIPTKLSARVVDQAGRVVFDDGVRDIRTTYKLNLPADLPLTPDRELKLEVTAQGPTGPASLLKQSLPLAPPVYLAHVTSDKPMYQPGETIRYRALVLDRFRLQPPAEEMRFTVKLLDPQGAQLESVHGREHSLSDKGDALPGLIAGDFVLPESAAGGEYTLVVSSDGDRLPEQRRKVLVNKYQPAQLQKELEFTRKSYGPGDEVVAACKVSRVNGPVVGQKVTATAQVDGQDLPVAISGVTDAQGGVTVKFKLPAAIERGDASLTVNFTDGGANESLNKPVAVVVKKIFVEFFPEGGDLVAGVPNRVYFQARTPLGKAAELRGKLVDGSGAIIAGLETLNDDKEPGINQGQGRFVCTPRAGETYHVEVKQPAGVVAVVQFPTVKSEGVVLTAGAGVTADDQPLRVQVTSAEKDRTLIVGAYARGRLLDHQRLVAPAGKPQAVKLAAAPGFGGVTRITVFAESGEGTKRTLTPVAERLVYRKPTKKTVLRVEPDKTSYAPGDKVRIMLTAVDEKGQPISAVAMLGVVNQSVVTMADEKTFRSMPTHFLLTGEVEKSEDLEHSDVLLGEHPQAAAALDLLLGVQGWRRFKEQGPEVPRNRNVDTAKSIVIPARSVDSLQAAMISIMEPKRAELVTARARLEKAAMRFEEAGQFPAELTGYQKKVSDAQNSVRTIQSERGDRSESIRQSARKALPVVAIVAGLGAMILAIVSWLRSQRLVGGMALAAGSLLAGVSFFMTQHIRNFDSVLAANIARPEAKADKAYPVADLALGEGEKRAGTRGGGGKEADAGGFGYGGGDKPGGPPPAPVMALASPAGNATPVTGKPTNEPLDYALKSGEDAKKERIGRGVVGGLRGYTKDIPTTKRIPEQKRAGQNGFIKVPAVPSGSARVGRPLTKKEQLDMAKAMQGKNYLEEVAGSYDDEPMTRPLIVREFAHKHANKSDSVRDDFTETVYWHPALILPKGNAEVSFDLADSVTRYQVLAAAHTGDGRLGAVQSEIAARKPLSVEPKLPVEVTAGDRIDVPVTIANDTDKSQSVKMTIESPGLAPVGPPLASQFNLAGNTRERRMLSFRPLLTEGTARLRLNVAGEDAIEMKLPVVPDGFPVAGSISDELRGSASHTVILPNTWVPDTLKCEVAVFPSPLADLQRGLEGMLQEPYGCFEQTSTTNYPNTLVLDYLRETNQADPALVSRAKGLLDRGYTRLTSFEVPGGGKREGYEWFGHAPAHEALTAYGLLQFRDMARVADVDPAMITRTRNYLMSRKDGKGGFQRSTAALDSFGRANEQVTNAYIVWAITESGKEDDVTAELNRLQNEVKTSNDPYFLALVANALMNRGRADAAAAPLAKLVAAQAADGSLTGTTVSITGSRGQPLAIETTSLALLGWLKAEKPSEYTASLRNAARWIGSQRKGTGSFGPTQSTIMALKALVGYARATKQPAEAGEMSLSVGNQLIGKMPYSTTASGALVMEIPNAEKLLEPGNNVLKVTTSGKNMYPYTVSWAYQTRQPPSAASCPVRLSTKLQKEELAEGDSTRLNITLENVSKQGQGMTTAIIGLPAGLKLPDDFKQLKELATPREGKAGPIAAWELRGRELILYWRDLAPDAKVELAIDLLANVPGKYQGPASRAYLYYNPDAKHWVPPLGATISAK